MRSLRVIFLWVAVVALARAESAPTPAALDLAAYQKEAASIFDPRFITASDGALADACAKVLLIFQAISVTIIVAGMIMKLRKDHEQMEGVATMMLKVAFIATIPFWRTYTLKTADSIAEAVGYPAISTDQDSPGMTRWWIMAHQWMPPSTPHMDALESQDPNDAPASGEEQSWLMRAANWARGVGGATMNMFGALWQTVTGGVRVFFVQMSCGTMSCALLVMIILTYLAEVLRYLLFYVGCAMLPVFIAGLGVEILKQQSIKYLLGLVSIAFWPLGWGLVNIGTTVMIDGVTQWMSRLVAAALGMKVGASVVPTIAVAAPWLAWGVLFLFVALTIAICVWSLVGLVYGPIAITRTITTGAQMMGGFIGAASSATAAVGAKVAGAGLTAATGGAAAPAAVGLGKAAAGVGKLGAWAAGKVGRAGHGMANVAGKIGGKAVGSAATRLANRMSGAATSMAAGAGGAAANAAGAMKRGLHGDRGKALRGALGGAEQMLQAAAGFDPETPAKAMPHLTAAVGATAAPWLRSRRGARH